MVAVFIFSAEVFEVKMDLNPMSHEADQNTKKSRPSPDLLQDPYFFQPSIPGSIDHYWSIII